MFAGIPLLPPPFSIDLRSVEEGPSSAFFSALDTVAGGTLFISLGVRFKAPQEGPAGQGCRPGQRRAWLVWRSAGRGRTMLPASLQVREAAKNGNFVPLISPSPCPPSPRSRLDSLAPSFEPGVPEIDWFILITFWHTGFCRVHHLAKCLKKTTQKHTKKWFLFPFHASLPFLKRGGLLPRTPEVASGFYCGNFGGQYRDDMPTMKQRRQSSRSPFIFHHGRQRWTRHLPQIVPYVPAPHLRGRQGLPRDRFVLGARDEALWARGGWKETWLNGEIPGVHIHLREKIKTCLARSLPLLKAPAIPTWNLSWTGRRCTKVKSYTRTWTRSGMR